ncbi:hypothetical protein [Thiopseudomonas alkaliphila]|jgi:hypothetical protein|uniref:hypothetical protein n=1 Tax=Gammaproteobacteria TaxID=1236 RepID=UPI002578F6D0|nr:hypothetical protein [Thiopseudomonas alkaliphila]MDM1708933.1 hypothetical protein [Thiopseudomonas alkaliphila]
MNDRDYRRLEIESRLQHLYNERFALEDRQAKGEGYFDDFDQSTLDMVNTEITEMEALRDMA